MARQFADILRELAGGKTYEECQDKMNELVAAVAETGKSGTLTLKFTVKANGREGAVEISDSVSIKKPESERGKTFYWTDAGGDLVRNDPRQTNMFGPKEVKTNAQPA